MLANDLRYALDPATWARAAAIRRRRMAGERFAMERAAHPVELFAAKRQVNGYGNPNGAPRVVFRGQFDFACIAVRTPKQRTISQGKRML